MITRSRYDTVVAAVEDVAGDAVRVVAVVSEDGRGHHEDLFYIRDDVSRDYTPDELDAIGAEMLFELWNHDYHGDLFQVGAMRYAAHRYDDAVIVMSHHGDFGVVVSVDADGCPAVSEVADAVQDGLDGEDGA